MAESRISGEKMTSRYFLILADELPRAPIARFNASSASVNPLASLKRLEKRLFLSLAKEGALIE